MTLLVRDEEDILVANLEHHLAAGVDHVYVTDNLSADSTRDLLVPYERAGVVVVIDETSDDYSQSVWVTRMARRAHAEGADWVINNDADEFWWGISNASLRDFFVGLGSEVDTVSATRSDFPPIEPMGRAPFWDRMIYRKTESLNALGRPLPPKVAHRAGPGVAVAQGNHEVTGLDGSHMLGDSGLEILHFPIRSEQQFMRKVVNGGRAYERNANLAPEVGSTWRYLYREYLSGRLEECYRRETVLDSQLKSQVGQGRLVKDTRLRERLHGLWVS